MRASHLLPVAALTFALFALPTKPTDSIRTASYGRFMPPSEGDQIRIPKGSAALGFAGLGAFGNVGNLGGGFGGFAGFGGNAQLGGFGNLGGMFGIMGMPPKKNESPPRR